MKMYTRRWVVLQPVAQPGLLQPVAVLSVCGCPLLQNIRVKEGSKKLTCRGDGFKSIVESSNGLCPGTYLLGRDTEMIHRGSTTHLGCVQPAAHTCTCWLAVAADSARTTEGSKYRFGWAEYGVNGPA